MASHEARADRAADSLAAALDPLPALPELGSHEVDVAGCPADRTQQTRTCREVMGYTVIATHSELSDFRMVVSSRAQLQLFLEPESCPRAVHAPVVEYRLYEGRPFAVIQQVDCLAAPGGQTRAERRPHGRFVVVRGLSGFEPLQHVVAIEGRKAGRALAQARKLADQHLLLEWPRLRTEIEAERARALAAADVDTGIDGEEIASDARPEEPVVTAPPPRVARSRPQLSRRRRTPDNVELSPDGKLTVFIAVPSAYTR